MTTPYSAAGGVDHRTNFDMLMKHDPTGRLAHQYIGLDPSVYSWYVQNQNSLFGGDANKRNAWLNQWGGTNNNNLGINDTNLLRQMAGMSKPIDPWRFGTRPETNMMEGLWFGAPPGGSPTPGSPDPYPGVSQPGGGHPGLPSLRGTMPEPYNGINPPGSGMNPGGLQPNPVVPGLGSNVSGLSMNQGGPQSLFNRGRVGGVPGVKSMMANTPFNAVRNRNGY